MKHSLFLFVLLSLVACGGGGGGSGKSPTSSTTKLEMELTSEENELVTYLLEARSLEQKALIKKLIVLNSLSENTLKKLDAFIDIQCSEAQSLCHITKKENL